MNNRLLATAASFAIISSSFAAEGELRSLAFGASGVVTAMESLHTPGVWEGIIVGDGPLAGGWVMQVDTNFGPVLVARGGNGRTLQSLPLGDGTFNIIDQDSQLGCGGAIEVPAPKPGEGGTAGACDNGSLLDVLVKWTPTASAAAGGETAIAALAEASVAISNHVYIASGVNLRMRAVGFGVTEPYSGDATSTVLSELRSTTDGILDGVHAERNALGADLVSLLSGSNPSYCGIGYLLGDNVPEYGFTVTVWSCALGGLTFSHEVGHNQGCCHAPGDGGGCTTGGVFPYSVGNRFTASNGTQYRTVMAYSPGTRIPRLSSPSINFLGTPTGTVDADNARTLNETAVVMANFRCAVSSPSESDYVVSPLLAFPIFGQTASFTALNVPQAAAGTSVQLIVTAVGDLGQSDESLSLRIGTANIGSVIGNTGSDCGVFSRRSAIPAATFNASIGSGASVLFTLSPSSGVTNTCSYSESRVVVRYRSAPPPCVGDLNNDRVVNGGDLGLMLSQWGACAGCAGDLNQDGQVSGADIGVMLAAWGNCP